MLTMRKAKAMGTPVRSRKTMPPKSSDIVVYHSMRYLPAPSPAILPQAILRNWMVSSRNPMGMMKKTDAFGTVTALTSVTWLTIDSYRISHAVIKTYDADDSADDRT